MEKNPEVTGKTGTSRLRRVQTAQSSYEGILKACEKQRGQTKQLLKNALKLFHYIYNENVVEFDYETGKCPVVLRIEMGCINTMYISGLRFNTSTYDIEGITIDTRHSHFNIGSDELSDCNYIVDYMLIITYILKQLNKY